MKSNSKYGGIPRPGSSRGKKKEQDSLKDPLRESTMSFFKEAFAIMPGDKERNESPLRKDEYSSPLTGSGVSFLRQSRRSAGNHNPSYSAQIKSNSISKEQVTGDIQSLIEEFSHSTSAFKDTINNKVRQESSCPRKQMSGTGTTFFDKS